FHAASLTTCSWTTSGVRRGIAFISSVIPCGPGVFSVIFMDQLSLLSMGLRGERWRPSGLAVLGEQDRLVVPVGRDVQDGVLLVEDAVGDRERDRLTGQQRGRGDLTELVGVEDLAQLHTAGAHRGVEHRRVPGGAGVVLHRHDEPQVARRLLVGGPLAGLVGLAGRDDDLQAVVVHEAVAAERAQRQLGGLDLRRLGGVADGVLGHGGVGGRGRRRRGRRQAGRRHAGASRAACGGAGAGAGGGGGAGGGWGVGGRAGGRGGRRERGGGGVWS